MAIKVLFFGQLTEITGFAELKIGETIDPILLMESINEEAITATKQTRAVTNSKELKEITNTKELKELLFKRFPGLTDIVFNIAVNTVIIEGDAALEPGSTVAFLPPFSGG